MTLKNGRLDQYDCHIQSQTFYLQKHSCLKSKLHILKLEDFDNQIINIYNKLKLTQLVPKLKNSTIIIR